MTKNSPVNNEMAVFVCSCMMQVFIQMLMSRYGSIVSWIIGLTDALLKFNKSDTKAEPARGARALTTCKY